MKRGSKWVALLALTAMLLALLPAGTLATAEEASQEQTLDDGVMTLEEAPRLTPEDVPMTKELEAALEEDSLPSGCGSFEALVWDDTANPDGALNEGEIYVDGLTVNLYIKRPDGTWRFYGSKVTGAEPNNFIRWVPWLNPIHEHGWVGWDSLPLSYTGIETRVGEDGSKYDYHYTDYKMELIPSGVWKPSNDTVREARLYEMQLWPFQWAPAIWCYPQNGDPAVRGFGVWEPSKISGNVFHDANANGKKDRFEPYLKGWTVILTVDLKEVARTTTNSSGYYEFTGLKCGFYQVWEKEKCFWKQIFYYHQPIVPRPDGVYRGYHFVWIQPHQTYGNLNFGNLSMNSICDVFYYNKYVLSLVKYWLGLGVQNPYAYIY